MKFRAVQLLFLGVLLFGGLGCGAVPSDETVTKGGLVYKIGDNKPFSGTVTGYSREGYRRHRMKYEKRYKHGIRHGDTKFWYANGKLESIEPYAKGRINGVVTQYYENGHIKARIHMENGRRGGAKGEQFWRENALGSKDRFKRFFK